MPYPNSIRIEVIDAVNKPIFNATARVKILYKERPDDSIGELTMPMTYPLRLGIRKIEIEIKAPDFVSEQGILTFDVNSSELKWVCTKPDWELKEADDNTILKIPLGRIKFAITAALPDTTKIKKFPFVPGGVLVKNNEYRNSEFDFNMKLRVLRKPAIGDPNSPGWDRFKWEQEKMNLIERGNWLMLEYGDTSQSPSSLRHLIGVWAPHNIRGEKPHVIVHIPPRTDKKPYPSDKFPFTGIYPYGCNPGPDGNLGITSKYIELKKCRQPYVELTSRRAKLVYQLYAARPDIFNDRCGPIVITLSPAFISQPEKSPKTLVLYEPFDNREGMGRLIAEVLRFLWSNQFTLSEKYLGTKSLRFNTPSTISIGIRSSSIVPKGFPKETSTTILCHSISAEQVQTLANYANNKWSSSKFPVNLYGGTNDYCEKYWDRIWIMDGLNSFKQGSNPIQIWRNWLSKGKNRRIVGVYTPSGLDGNENPGLINLSKAARVTGKTGWIEEDNNDVLYWLRFSYTYLQAFLLEEELHPSESTIFPIFDNKELTRNPEIMADDIHGKLFDFGIAYAARCTL
ncbi:hypothetical protein WBS53_30180 [Bacillus albus]|uniref:hypothetical protein n=1 Tax=Bacillus albus TaxID=2026189 RepID=UPI003014FE63